MIIDDLIEIETKLNIKLPKFYKNVMLNYPFEEFEKYSNLRITLNDDKKWLIAENIDLRENGFNSYEWPDNLFAFGHDGCGDYYFIDLNNEEENIYYADHECEFNYNEIKLFQSSLKEFMDFEIEIENESNE